MSGVADREKAHHITIRLIDSEAPTDARQRIDLLMTAFFYVVRGQRLIDVPSADFVGGCIEILIRGKTPIRNGLTGAVRVDVEPADPRLAVLRIPANQ